MKSMYNPDALAMGARTRAMTANRVYNFVYGWMALGLVVSGIIAQCVANAVMSGALVLSGAILIGCTLAEVAIVVLFGAAVRKLPPALAALLFVGFSALNGVTISTLLLVYTAESVTSAFFVTAGTFAAMALLGTITKRDLSVVGRCCFMLLIGAIIATVLNLFIGSSGFRFLIDLLCVGIFVGLSAYDAQSVRQLADQHHNLDRVSLARFGLVLALELYLDFINLFILILRLFGDRR